MEPQFFSDKKLDHPVIKSGFKGSNTFFEGCPFCEIKGILSKAFLNS
ncbi:hypothetical protein [Clostridium rectalis]|nr:hypothetical protein [Clostridium rectalis]